MGSNLHKLHPFNSPITKLMINRSPVASDIDAVEAAPFSFQRMIDELPIMFINNK